jgi:hypothetical protein
MELTKEEKAKAFAVFIKSKENREAFLSGCELDQEAITLGRTSLALQESFSHWKTLSSLGLVSHITLGRTSLTLHFIRWVQ